MFEEICLSCGKPVEVDGRAYCSDECENLDATSPSISSSSSAFPSPHLPQSMTGLASDVPALIPSALGGALASRGAGNRYSFTSASSNWSSSAFEEEDEEYDSSPVYGLDEDYAYLADVPMDPMAGTTTKSPAASSSLPPIGLTKSMPSSALAYARRPSTTNNRSTVPHLHRRISSGSTPSELAGIATSAPATALYPSDDDLSYSDDPVCRTHTFRHSQKAKDDQEDGTAKPRAKRNRASLPSYFALLQTGSSPASPSTDGSSKYSCSSIHTLTTLRSTSPTPTFRRPPNSAVWEAVNSRERSAVNTTPRRGRRKERGSEDESSVSRRDTLSRSPSRASRSRSSRQRAVPAMEEQEVSAAYSPETRGRAAARREHAVADAMAKLTMGYGRSSERDTSEGRRGRLRSDELDFSAARRELAPGLGSGRSGLRDRERAMR
ncbi:hypothetical protein OE88DRAFT_948130 [Heliocybe sulcata]|uniref:Uncharacterized protein n=1 Tax=Heliocybe sulcata TaxID=5364 RepID=A0A5C3NBM6_9AGAM|nr:hypothetical protein OE88DRAFT_948130 [Heliocybe sulcata]